MADYYTKFSMILPAQEGEEQEWLRSAAKELERVVSDDLDADECLRTSAAPDLTKLLLEVLDDLGYGAPNNVLPAAYAFEERGCWLHTEDVGGTDFAAALIQAFLRRFNKTDVIGFEFAHDCSKPRLDAYGGGAMVITAQVTRWMTTYEWMQDTLRSFQSDE